MLAMYSMIAVQVADLDFVPFWASWRNGKSYQFRDRHRDLRLVVKLRHQFFTLCISPSCFTLRITPTNHV